MTFLRPFFVFRRWDLIDNLHSVPEDCDQRNERWGWMADASVSAEANYQYHWMPALCKDPPTPQYLGSSCASGNPYLELPLGNPLEWL